MFRWWRTGLGAAFAVAVCIISTCQQRSGERTPEAERSPSANVSPAPPVSPEVALAEPEAPAEPPAPAAPPAVPAPAQQPNSAPAPVVPLGPNAKTEDERNSISVFEAVAPATVFVTSKRRVVDFSRQVSSEVPTGSGSGFVWDAEGHIVTNHHVVAGAQSLSVTLFDHRSFEARVVGADPRRDIAVLRLLEAPSNLRPIRVEKGLELFVGQKTLAIGNPFGLDQTLTTGIISALGRSVPGQRGVTMRDMVQTDAAINPGNSGGPLIDSSGRLIGMNTMIFSRSGASAGIGFAVPVSSIMRAVPQIIKTGSVGQLGIGIVIDPARQLERTYGVSGVLVLRVPEDGPAARAGLRGTTMTRRGVSFGDVIIGIDGEPVKDFDALAAILDRHSPGDKVKLTILRGNEKLTVPIELVLLPAD
jgi:S1-C subfamily serine protease